VKQAVKRPHPGHKNLRPPVKGEVRNPKGKPKGTLNTKTIMRMIMKAKVDVTVAEKVCKHMRPFTGALAHLTVQQVAHMQQANKAIAGDLHALRFCQAAMGDPVVETVKVQGDKNNPLTPMVTPLVVELTAKTAPTGEAKQTERAAGGK
jgi:hypothetical protein